MRTRKITLFLIAVLFAGMLVAPLSVAAAASPADSNHTVDGSDFVYQSDEDDINNSTDEENESEDGAESNVVSDREANLAIRQPSYVDNQIQDRRVDGKLVYVARGEELRIAPTNFEVGSVTDYGVNSDVGTLEYDRDFGSYVFNPEGNEGTFSLYWVVDDGDERLTYSVMVQIDGQSDLEHVAPGTVADLRDDADAWQDWNSTVSEIGEMGLLAHMMGGSPNNEEIMQGMVNTYITTRSPFRAFSGGYSSMYIFGLTSLGGILFFLQWSGMFAWIVRSLHGRVNRFESVEAEEGELADRQLDLEKKERLQRLANMDWQDIPGVDDHSAAAFREHMGETVLDGWGNLLSIILPENVVSDRLQVMGQSGYAARITETDTDGRPSNAELVDLSEVLHSDEEIEDREDLAELRNPSDELVRAIDWNDPLLVEFDLVDAEFSQGDIDATYETMDLETLIDRLDAQMHHFRDEEQYGRFLREFVTSIRDHPFTDEEGRPDDVRYVLNQWLQTAQFVGDRHNYPLASYLQDAFERAVDDHDIGEKAEQTAKDVKRGSYA